MKLTGISPELEQEIETQGQQVAMQLMEYMQHELVKMIGNNNPLSTLIQMVAYAHLSTAFMATHLKIVERTNPEAASDKNIKLLMKEITDAAFHMSKKLSLHKYKDISGQ